MRLQRYRTSFEITLQPGLYLFISWRRGLSVRLWDVRGTPWRIVTLVGPAFQPGSALRRKKGAQDDTRAG